MQREPEIKRQLMRCGRAMRPAIDIVDGAEFHAGIRLQSWKDADVCAGYACSLPEVSEVAGCFIQWEKGTLEPYLDGEPPSRTLLDALAFLQLGIRDHQDEMMRRSSKGGA